ncbi:sensor histidine kinase [Chitinophaga sp. Cy-1792]|uniref:sensor histidine kinase n=1 Tax=Chitinophaga sp. Cy-1792 TaxID=2608339 RepID=UPI0014241993|nr:histidine kinase [Chitinophaga sp. Cy-1792]NIG52783.1 sensor histidine kinase [Chitinophaga sp. Cy-1792]
MFKVISKYWWCQILGWLAYFLINAFIFSVSADLLVFTLMGVMSTHLFRYLIHKADWGTYSLDKQLLLFFWILVGSGTLLFICYYLILRFIFMDEQPISDVFRRLVTAYLIATMWWTIYFLYHYVERTTAEKVDQLTLQATVKELELKTIKAQLNPHFIFNALNSIRALVDENPQRARTAITELSNILRSSMAAEKSETVSMEKELNIVRDYLALETIRFEERLVVTYDIDPDTLSLQVPPMMLQTLVENAIKHGISKTINGGNVMISSHLKGLQHEITIENTGQFVENARNGHGFGLESTRQRLSLLFGNRASFAIRNKDAQIVEARVLMPIL